MLQTQTVTPGTLELLRSLMQDDMLKDFILAGATALSLRIGHRMSIGKRMPSLLEGWHP